MALENIQSTSTFLAWREATNRLSSAIGDAATLTDLTTAVQLAANVPVGTPENRLSWTGTQASFTVNRDDSGQNYTATIAAPGTGYQVGDQIRIRGSLLQGVDATNDLTITVSTVDSSGEILTVSTSGNAPKTLEGALNRIRNDIGTATLTTTAQTITGAINELDSEIGSTALGTTAADITGAISELEDDIGISTTLETTAQTITGAINELANSIGNLNLTETGETNLGYVRPTVDGTVNSGATTITLDSATGIDEGDFYKTGSTEIEITDITGNVLTLASGVPAIIADNAEITIFKRDITVAINALKTQIDNINTQIGGDVSTGYTGGSETDIIAILNSFASLSNPQTLGTSYLRRSGSDAMTGTLDVGSFGITSGSSTLNLMTHATTNVTVNGAISSGTTVILDSASGVSVGDYLKHENELLEITAVNANTITLASAITIDDNATREVLSYEQHVRINSAGRIGIGKSPHATHQVDVSGNVNAANLLVGNASINTLYLPGSLASNTYTVSSDVNFRGDMTLLDGGSGSVRIGGQLVSSASKRFKARMQDIIGEMFTGNSETGGISATYNTSTSKIDISLSSNSHTHMSANITNFTEAVQDILGGMAIRDEMTAIASGQISIGDFTITLQDATGIAVGDFYKEGSTEIEITTIAGNIITLATAVAVPVADGAAITIAKPTNATGISITYDDVAGKLNFNVPQTTDEDIQDIVGAMVSGNTETGIAVSYDDSTGKLNFNVPQTTDEAIQDIAGAMVTGNTESGIAVTYDDSSGKLNFDVSDPTITLAGDVTGSATIMDLSNTSITTTVAAEPVQDIAGDMFSGNTETGITATYQDSDGTIDLVIDTEYIQDAIGAMVSGNTETGVSATYQDSTGKLNFSALTATDAQQGIVELATVAEHRAATPSGLLAATPAGVKGKIDASLDAYAAPAYVPAATTAPEITSRTLSMEFANVRVASDSSSSSSSGTGSRPALARTIGTGLYSALSIEYEASNYIDLAKSAGFSADPHISVVTSTQSTTGSTTITVADATGVIAGDYIRDTDGTEKEITGISGNTLTLASGISSDIAASNATVPIVKPRLPATWFDSTATDSDRVVKKLILTGDGRIRMEFGGTGRKLLPEVANNMRIGITAEYFGVSVNTPIIMVPNRVSEALGASGHYEWTPESLVEQKLISILQKAMHHKELGTSAHHNGTSVVGNNPDGRTISDRNKYLKLTLSYGADIPFAQTGFNLKKRASDNLISQDVGVFDPEDSTPDSFESETRRMFDAYDYTAGVSPATIISTLPIEYEPPSTRIRIRTPVYTLFQLSDIKANAGYTIEGIEITNINGSTLTLASTLLGGLRSIDDYVHIDFPPLPVGTALEYTPNTQIAYIQPRTYGHQQRIGVLNKGASSLEMKFEALFIGSDPSNIQYQWQWAKHYNDPNIDTAWTNESGATSRTLTFSYPINTRSISFTNINAVADTARATSYRNRTWRLRWRIGSGTWNTSPYRLLISDHPLYLDLDREYRRVEFKED